MEQEQIISKIYTAFNNRDIDGVLKFFAHDVEWPNGWKGGCVHGHQQVRDYWTRQWAELNPIVTPESLKLLQDGRLLVEVKQVVKDLAGNMVFNGPVKWLLRADTGTPPRQQLTYNRL